MTHQNVIVLGMGLSGRAASAFLIAQGHSVYGIDKDQKKLEDHRDIILLKSQGLQLAEDVDLSKLSSFDLIIVSPGINPDHPILKAAEKIKIPTVGEMELGCRFFRNTALGITGTNGKTTVTQLTTHVLNHCHKKAKSLGNVGEPLTKELMENQGVNNDIFVLELSSYQLETLYTPCLRAGVILNITPDHLDRYSSLEEYAQAKCHITRALLPQAPLFVAEQTWHVFGHLIKNAPVYLYGYHPSSHLYTDLKDVYLHGEKVFSLPPSLQNAKNHDTENILASFALCHNCGIDGKQFISAWETFKKPPHRIELFATHSGISFFDDSKGTNIDATIRAVESMNGPVHLIAGGVDKCFPYTSWVVSFKGKVKHVFAIGQAADKIKKDLSPHIEVSLCSSLSDATSRAIENAQNGDNILLSPGCSSFDMFRDYAHRGEEFQRIVRERLK